MNIINPEYKELFNQTRDGIVTPEFKENLVRMGDDVNGGDSNNVRLIHIACCNANLEVFKELLALDTIELNVKDRYKRTLLHAAVLGHSFTEHPIQSYMRNMNYEEENAAYFKDTPPDSGEQLEIIRIILEHGRSVSINSLLNGYHIFSLAVMARVSLQVFQLLVTAPNVMRNVINCNRALQDAIRRNQGDLLSVMANEPTFIANLNF